MVVLYFVLLMAAAPLLAAIALGVALVQILVYWRAGRLHAELMAEQLATQAKLSGFQVEMLAGMESVKSMGAEQRMSARFTDLYVDVLNAALAKGRLVDQLRLARRQRQLCGAGRDRADRRQAGARRRAFARQRCSR